MEDGSIDMECFITLPYGGGDGGEIPGLGVQDPNVVLFQGREVDHLAHRGRCVVLVTAERRIRGSLRARKHARSSLEHDLPWVRMFELCECVNVQLLKQTREDQGEGRDSASVLSLFSMTHRG